MEISSIFLAVKAYTNSTATLGPSMVFQPVCDNRYSLRVKIKLTVQFGFGTVDNDFAFVVESFDIERLIYFSQFILASPFAKIRFRDIELIFFLYVRVKDTFDA